ncbi:cardiolipin synthase [Flavilitoribacter nigricans]|uniref:Cardiolipin synthase n=1 Tax=Flavilitoribacter nigricans (strain ATCC 23147 / DSM 23189 / NBRC 102662 / NCIMB 1420 / SS-2) TaxID=1122177 RepID=A0A2D0N8P1_FLAN2|nr:cardiolipin synthase [Flavilitoribacter nigricans]PHN04845.1 cardiolipin synthase [Flavilitoribacter nigricans DSM 23189 = NBRC 102662]
MLFTLLFIAYILATIGVVLNLLISGARPTKTMAWLLVVIVLPVLGIILYLVFGVNRRKYKFYKIKEAQKVKKYLSRVDGFYEDHFTEQAILPENRDIYRKTPELISKNCRFLPYPDNKAKILRNGPATFDAIFDALEKAETFIHIQYYIFEEGELTDRMMKIFKEKAKAGVEIRLLYDGVGSQFLSNKYTNQLQELGGNHSCFLPIANMRPTSTLNYRNHRKIIIVDGKIGFTGGINVTDKYIRSDAGPLGIWHDMHLQLEGPIVNSLQAVFVTDWNFATEREENGDLLKDKYFPKSEPKGDAVAQIVASGPDSDFSSIRQEYFSLITQADDYVYITNSYVIPGEAILTALQTAALSGVDVRLIIPETSDSVVVKWGVRSYFEEMLRAGVRIYLYKDNFLHSKTLVADDEVISIGTANFDLRSFEQNFEVNALVYNESLAKELKSYFMEDIENCEELKLEEFKERPVGDKIKEGIAKIFSPIL